MFQLLYDPVAEIHAARRPSYARVLMYLLTASLFETVGVLFVAWRFWNGRLSQGFLVNGVVALLFSLIVVHLVVAFFFSVAMHVLDGRGGYYEGLACVVLGMVAPAVMTFFAGAVVFVPYGVVFSAILLTYGYVLGSATFFRAGKELFELEYDGVLSGCLITILPLAAALSTAMFLL